jgi:hypothetical protein
MKQTRFICPKCQGEMWFDRLTTISFIDQPGVIKKILQHIGLWEESHAPERDPPIKEITFDPFYGSTVRVPHGPEEDRRVNSPSRGRSRDSQLI